MEAWGYLNIADEKTMIRALLDPTPEDFVETAVNASETDDWTSFVTPVNGNPAFAVYMKRVTDRPYEGGMAFLTVLMPARIT